MQGLNNFYRFGELRKQFPRFSYEAYEYRYTGKSLEIGFSFKLSDDISFNPKAIIPWKDQLFRPYAELSESVLDHLVFHIGMIELISYWKAACPPSVQVRTGKLSEEQVSFWKKLFFNGLGEFFYLNGIRTNEDDFMDIQSAGKPMSSPFSCDLDDKAIVPVGGGKDSAVTMETLNKGEVEWIPMAINPREATRGIISAAGKDEEGTIIIQREIDPQLLKLNREGFLNGHTPFSALLAFYTLLIAYLSGHSDILLSNESSANEPTIPGTRINHQYSKSIEFEADFREYCREFISPAFNYFSFLRPMSEVQIAGLFSNSPKYFKHFKSCNVGSKTDSWCCKCSKCLFTYIMLAPFIKKEQLLEIFGKDLLDDISLKPILDELTGMSEIKPFECIGTVDEVNSALDFIIEKNEGKALPELLELYRKEWKGGPVEDHLITMMMPRKRENFLPRKYKRIYGFPEHW